MRKSDAAAVDDRGVSRVISSQAAASGKFAPAGQWALVRVARGERLMKQGYVQILLAVLTLQK